MPDQLNDLLVTLFEKYLLLLQSQYSSTLSSVRLLGLQAAEHCWTDHVNCAQTVERDDLQSMVIDGPEDLDRVLKICWMPNGFAQRLQK